MSLLFLQQSSLHEETARLGQACQDLQAGSRQRAEELAELSEMLNRVKQQSWATAGDGTLPSQGGTSAPIAPGGSAGDNRPFGTKQEMEFSPGGRTPIPRVVQNSLGALSSANRTLSAFQDELDSGLSQLAQHASEARRTASTVRAHVDFLHQLVSPRKAGTGIPSPMRSIWPPLPDGTAGGLGPGGSGPSAPPQAGTPDEEVASLLRVLQEAAQQRAMAETSLRSPSPRGRTLWSDDLLNQSHASSGPAAGLLDEPGGFGMQAQTDEAALSAAGVSDALLGAVASPAAARFPPPSQYTDRRFDFQPGEGSSSQQSGAQQHLGDSNNGSGGSTGSGALPPSLDAKLAEQTHQLQELQRGVLELEAQRRELIGILAETSSKVTSCSIELEAVRAELETAKAQLELQKQHMQAVHDQTQATEHHLREKLQQLEYLDAMVQASTAQLAELQDSIAAATAVQTAATSSGAAAQGAARSGGSQDTPSHHRTKRKAKRHPLVRRSQSCTDLSVLLSGQPSTDAAAGLHSPLLHQPGDIQGTPPIPEQGEGGAEAVVTTTTTAASAAATSRIGVGVGGHAIASASAPVSATTSPTGSSGGPVDRLTLLHQELQALAAEHSKALLQLEQERHAGMAQQGELVALRQKLRAQQMANIATNTTAALAAADDGRAAGGAAGAGFKRPLSAAVSGMEELLEEAAADLEQLEGHVANVTQRLLDLQAQSLRMAQQTSAALRSKASAEAQADEELQRVKALREEAESLKRAASNSQLLSTRLDAQLATARSELQQLEGRVEEQRAQLQQCRALEQEQEARVQDAQRRLLQEEHAREVVEQARKAAEHELQQLQAQMAEVEHRMKQAEQEASSARDHVKELSEATGKTMREQSATLEELEQLQRMAADAKAELATMAEALATSRQEHTKETGATAELAERRAEAERELQAGQEELQRVRQQLQQGEADLKGVQGQLASLRQEQQELAVAVEEHRRQAVTAKEELEAVRLQAAAAASRREEAEKDLQACQDELQAARLKVQQEEADVKDVQAQLDSLRQQQQELLGAVQRHEQQAAAAERRAASTERELEDTREQMAAAQQQLAEAAAQVAALRGAAAGVAALDGGGGGGAGIGSLHVTPAAAVGLGPNPFADFALQHGAGGVMLGGNTAMGQYGAHRHLTMIMQLQAEVERLQVAMVQAQSRQRLADQRAADAEQMSTELQTRLATLRTQQHALRTDFDIPPPASTATASVQHWRTKADELQQELEALQHLLGRYKTRLTAAQDEVASLEEGLQREKSAAGRLRHQVEDLQEELQSTRTRLRSAEGALQKQQQEKQKEREKHREDLGQAAAALAAASPPPAPPAPGAAAAGVLTPPSPGIGEQVEQAKHQLRSIQAQILQQQKVHSELLEGHTKLQRHGAEMQSQLEQAAGQLVALKVQYDKGKRKVDSLQEHKDELQGAVSTLAAQEQQLRTRLQELQRQASALESSRSTAQQGALAAQQELREVRVQVAEAQKALAAIQAQRDTALAEAAEAEQRRTRTQPWHPAGVPGGMRLGGDGDRTQGQLYGVGGGVGTGATAAWSADVAETAASLKQQLRVARQAQAAAEESLAEERRQLQQCKGELAAALTVRASHDAATARLQHDLEKLQAQVTTLQASRQGHTPAALPPLPPDPSSAAVTPVGPGRHMALVPRDGAPGSAAPGGGPGPSPSSAIEAAALALHSGGVPAVWAGTPGELAAARRELHGLELRIAVASADEARLTAACAELRRQQAAADQELASLREQVAEAEQRLAAAQAGAAQGVRDAQSALGELIEVRTLVRSLQQQVHTAETAEAEAKHQAQLAALRMQHSEEQLRILQQQAAQQAHSQSGRLDEALAACERERQRVIELQERITLMKQQADEQAAALYAQSQDHAAALQAHTRDHASRVEALEAALEQAKAQDAAAAEALAGSRAEVSRLRSELELLSAQLAEEGTAKKQLCSEIARSGQGLSEARTEAEQLRAQIAHLTSQLAEAERTRVLMVSEAAGSATALAAAEAAAERLRGEAQDMAGRLQIVENAYSQLRTEQRELAQELSASRADCAQAQGWAAKLKEALAGADAAAAVLREQLAKAQAEATELRERSRGAGGGSGGDVAARSEGGRSIPVQEERELSPEPSQLQQAAMEQLLVDCEALREQRDAALGELQQAAAALRAADGRAQELTAANDLLEGEVARLQRLALAAVAMVEHLQQQQQALRPVQSSPIQSSTPRHHLTEAPLGNVFPVADGRGSPARAQAQQVPTDKADRATQTESAEGFEDAAGMVLIGRGGAAEQSTLTLDAAEVTQGQQGRTHPGSQTDTAGSLGAGATEAGAGAERPPDTAAYTVLLQAPSERAALERRLAQVQDELQSALRDKAELELRSRSLEASLSNQQDPQPSPPQQALQDDRASQPPQPRSQPRSEPRDGLGGDAPDDALPGAPTEAPTPMAAGSDGTEDVVTSLGHLQHQVGELTARLSQVQLEADDANSRAVKAQQQAEKLSGSLTAARDLELQARQALRAALAEQMVASGQVAALREQLQTERGLPAAPQQPQPEDSALAQQAPGPVLTATEAARPRTEAAAVRGQADGLGSAASCRSAAFQTEGGEVGATHRHSETQTDLEMHPHLHAQPSAAQGLIFNPGLASDAPCLDPGLDRPVVASSRQRLREEVVQEVLPALVEEATQEFVLALKVEAAGRAQLQAQLSQLAERHATELQGLRADELRRLQCVRDEYNRLETHLQSELERLQAAAAQATAELRECQAALAAAERHAADAVQEAVRSAQQAATYQAQLLALRQRLERQSSNGSEVVTGPRTQDGADGGGGSLGGSSISRRGSVLGSGGGPGHSHAATAATSAARDVSSSSQGVGHGDGGGGSTKPSITPVAASAAVGQLPVAAGHLDLSASSSVRTAPAPGSDGSQVPAPVPTSAPSRQEPEAHPQAKAVAAAAAEAGSAAAASGAATAPAGAAHVPSHAQAQAQPAAIQGSTVAVGAAAGSEEARRALEAELDQLRRQCTSLDRQRALQQEELQRLHSKLAATEARHATAAQQVTALHAELRARDATEEDEVRLRVAQQAEADAKLLCEVRAQLRACEERLERSKREAERALAELDQTRAELEALQNQQEQLPCLRRTRYVDNGVYDRGLQQHYAEQQQLQRERRRGRRSNAANRPAVVGNSRGGGPLGLALDREQDLYGAEEQRRSGIARADAVQVAVRRVMAALVGAGGDPGSSSGGGGGASSQAGCSGDDDKERHTALLSHRAASRSRWQISRSWSQQRGPAAATEGSSSDSDGSYDSLAEGDHEVLGLLEDLRNAGLAFTDEDDGNLSEELQELLHMRGTMSPRRRYKQPRRRGGRGSLRPSPHGPLLPLPASGGNPTMARELAVCASLQPFDGLVAAAITATAVAACQTDNSAPAPGEYGALVPLSRMAATSTHLAELQQQHSGLLARVAALRCQAVEAEALAEARTTQVAELQAREQQLAAVCAAMHRQAEEAVWQLQDHLARCQASAEEVRSALDSDCQRLRQLRSDLQVDVGQARELLRECVGALRLGHASLRAHRAVDEALMGLSMASAEDRGSGSQALQHVKAVFSCMAELCGRAEALAAALGPLVSRLGATMASPCTPFTNNPWAPSGGLLPPDGCADHSWASTRPGPIYRPLTSPQHPGRSGAATAAAAEALTADAPVTAPPAPAGSMNAAEVQKALKRAYLQLHARAKKFSKVLKAVAAGEQLPAAVLHEGFQRLWSSTEEQLGCVLRMASGSLSSSSEALPPATSPAAGHHHPAPRTASATSAAAPTHSAEEADENRRTTGVGRPTTSSITAPLNVQAVVPPVRAPLAPVHNILDGSYERYQQQQPLQGKKRGAAPESSGAANRRAAAPLGDAKMRQDETTQPSLKDLHVVTSSRQQQNQQQPQRRMPLGVINTSPSLPVQARQHQTRRQQQQQQQVQFVGLEPEPLQERRPHDRLNMAPGTGRALTSERAGGEDPQRRRLEVRLQQVLNLAKELQAKDGL